MSKRPQCVRGVLREAVPTPWGAQGGGGGCPPGEEPANRALVPALALQGVSSPSWASASVKGDVHQAWITQKNHVWG